MNNIIINKFEHLSPEIQMLVSKPFNSKEHTNIIYIKGYSNIAHIIKLPYNLCLYGTIITFGFFAFELIQETIKWNAKGEFRTEGVAILGMICLFFGLLFLISKKVYNKNIQIQKKVALGEINFGLWITPNFIVTNFVNGGYNCVLRSDILSISTYRSSKLDYVHINLPRNKIMRIIPSWLVGYENESEKLKQIFEQYYNKSITK
jgi:hypothetical protein